jgi:hypothetical protein
MGIPLSVKLFDGQLKTIARPYSTDQEKIQPIYSRCNAPFPGHIAMLRQPTRENA